MNAATQTNAETATWSLARLGNGFTDVFVDCTEVAGMLAITVHGTYPALSQFRPGNTIPVSRHEAADIAATLAADGFSD